MIQKYLNDVLRYIEKSTSKKDEVIEEFYNQLKHLNLNNITNEKLEELNNLAVKIDATYDNFADLNYYFDPFYVEIKCLIQKRYVNDLRKKNRKKILQLFFYSSISLQLFYLML